MNHAPVRGWLLLILAIAIACLTGWMASPAHSSAQRVTTIGRSAALSPAPLSERVLVVYNAEVPESLEVADYYMSRRGIPQNRKCAISPQTTTLINSDAFDAAIKAPIRNCLNAIGRGQILYIVFSYQTPYKILLPDAAPASSVRALDQYVADIWDEYSSDNALFREHPYYAAAQSQGNAYQPFVSLADYRLQAGAKSIYSVWRLDAPSLNLAKSLVDKAIAAETSGLVGQGCFDRNRGNLQAAPDSGYLAADWDLFRAAGFVRQAGFAVTEDDQDTEFGTPPAPARCDNAAFYSGWYSYNNYNDAFTWNVGAIGYHLDSASALDPRGGANWSANALARGITVTSGAVNEPYLEGLPRADGLFRNFFEGANAGDAFLRNTAFLKWMVLNLGDPLYRPFGVGVAPFNSPDYRPASLALDPQFVIAGDSSTATLTLAEPSPPGGTVVTLTSNNASLVNLPAGVTVPAGATTATFNIATAAVLFDAPVIITASYDATSLSNTLILLKRYEGFHDSADCDAISGWAWDRGQPDASINVDIYDGGILLATVPANIFRQDLFETGRGNGNYGFSYATPPSVKDGQPHTIHVKYGGTNIALDETGKSITCSGPTPTPTPPPPSAAYNGYHDSVDCALIYGWAWDQNRPNTPINVDIYADDELIATVSADGFRQDLINAGIGNGVHGFTVATPQSLRNGQSHTIRVRFAGTTTDLNTTPKTLVCAAPTPTPTPTPAPTPTPIYNGYHDSADCALIYGWAWDQHRPNAPVSVDVYADGQLLATVVADRFRQDLLNAGIGNGAHGFVVATPAGLRDAQAHTIRVRFAATTLDLNTTPKTLVCAGGPTPTPTPSPAPAPSAFNGYHDYADCGSIGGWAWNANQPNTPVSVDVYADDSLLASVTADRFRQDLLNAGIGNGAHGFDLAMPASLRNGQSHTIRVRFAGTSTDLNTTPKTIVCTSQPTLARSRAHEASNPEQAGRVAPQQPLLFGQWAQAIIDGLQCFLMTASWPEPFSATHALIEERT